MMIKEALLQQLTQVRRALHSRPEVSGEEKETSAYVIDYLSKFQPTRLLTGVGGTGIIATFDSGKPGEHLLFRAELDALPIQEANSFPHRSIYAGVSHKCGHDGHTTVLLGLAHLLNRSQEWTGQVSLLFQPAEETGAGAMAMLADPQIEQIKVDKAFAFHNLPGYPLGQIIWKKDAFTPAVQSLIIQLEGKTAHAAEPQNGLNPALAIAEILQHAQQLQITDPLQTDFRLLTPVYLTMGEKAYGVSAGAGEVHLTLRAWTQEEMEVLTATFLEKVKAIANHSGLSVDFSWTDTFKANFNAGELVAQLQQSIRRNSLSDAAMEQPLTWGEDFGAFGVLCPTAMFGIGAGENSPALHHPDYDFPDEILSVGLQVFWGIICS